MCMGVYTCIYRKYDFFSPRYIRNSCDDCNLENYTPDIYQKTPVKSIVAESTIIRAASLPRLGVREHATSGCVLAFLQDCLAAAAASLEPRVHIRRQMSVEKNRFFHDIEILRTSTQR